VIYDAAVWRYIFAFVAATFLLLSAVADPAMGGPGGRPPPIDLNLGLVMAARLRHGGKFSPKSLTFGHIFV